MALSGGTADNSGWIVAYTEANLEGHGSETGFEDIVRTHVPRDLWPMLRSPI
jgi:hypothetical protein